MGTDYDFSRAEIGLVSPRSRSRFSSRPKGIIVHYLGRPDPLLPQTQANLFNYLRGIQKGHMAPGGLGAKNGGADIAYNIFYGADQWVFEGRGLEYQSGANGSASDNREYLAVCFLVGVGQDVAETQLARFLRDRQDWISRGLCGSILKGHNEVRSTSCPGEQLKRFIQNPRKYEKVSVKPAVIRGETVKEIKTFLIEVGLDDAGNGWTRIPNQKWGRDPLIVGLGLHGSAPEREGYWYSRYNPIPSAQAADGGAIVSVNGGEPRGRVGVWVSLGRP